MESQNHFALFGLEPAFHIDETQLDKQYRSLQALLHPDRYASASDREQRLAADKSSAINVAYYLLKDPTSRAVYLLETEGEVFNEETDTLADGEFLMEMMEVEEQIQQSCAEQNHAEAQAVLSDLLQRLQDTRTQFQQAWQHKDISEARVSILKMKFLDKVCHRGQEAIKALEATQ